MHPMIIKFLEFKLFWFFYMVVVESVIKLRLAYDDPWRDFQGRDIQRWGAIACPHITPWYF